MLKVNPPDGYPLEEGRYIRGNDYSPVAVCIILDTFAFAMPMGLKGLVRAGVDSGVILNNRRREDARKRTEARYLGKVSNFMGSIMYWGRDWARTAVSTTFRYVG
jgi:hypothetical protein